MYNYQVLICHYVSTTFFQSNASISMCNELTNDTRSSRNKHFIMTICSLFLCHHIMYFLGFFNTTGSHEHACLFLIYEKCNIDRVGKMPSNKTVSSDLKSFSVSDCELRQYQLAQKRGEGCERYLCNPVFHWVPVSSTQWFQFKSKKCHVHVNLLHRSNSRAIKRSNNIFGRHAYKIRHDNGFSTALGELSQFQKQQIVHCKYLPLSHTKPQESFLRLCMGQREVLAVHDFSVLSQFHKLKERQLRLYETVSRFLQDHSGGWCYDCDLPVFLLRSIRWFERLP